MKININNIECQPYKTTDFYLACYLCAKEFSIVRIEKDSENSRRIIFVFKYMAKLKETIDKYYDGSALVSVKRFKYAIKDLKSVIYQK